MNKGTQAQHIEKMSISATENKYLSQTLCSVADEEHWTVDTALPVGITTMLMPYPQQIHPRGQPGSLKPAHSERCSQPAPHARNASL